MRKLFFILTLLCVSLMTWATKYCNTTITAEDGVSTVTLTCVQPEAGTYVMTIVGGSNFGGFIGEGNYFELSGVGGNQVKNNTNEDNRVCNFDEGSRTLTVTMTADRAPKMYTPLYLDISGQKTFTTIQNQTFEWPTECASCTDETAPTVTAVAKSDITHNSIVLTVTAADNDGGTGIASYIVKNGDTQIASSATSPITVTGLTAGTTYNNIKVITKDGCNNESSAFDVESFTTLNRPSECSGDLGHWAVPATKRISYTIEYFSVIDKIKYTVHGYNTEVLNYLEIRTTEGVSGSLGITDGVAIWFQNAPAAGTEMAVQFYYGLESLGGGREITADGAVSLSNPQCTYYKSHDCENSTYPATVPAAPDDKNDCQVFSIFGTEGFMTNATHAEAWDGAKSFLTGKIDGKDAYFTTAGTTANIQYPSKNINEYDKLHFDIWTDAAREIGVELCINAGTHGTKQNITTTAGAWKSVELDITGFHDPKDVNTTFLFFSSLARETYYLANVYLYKTADDESCYESLNIALKKPVVAGYTPSSLNEVPSKANDGNEGSEWTTWQNRPASEEWWYVDLLHVYNLTNISILWGGDYSTNYILQTRIEEPTVADRANDEAWTTVATVTDATASAVKSNNITAAGRYVRIHSLARSNVNLIRMKEFRVFGSGFADVDTEKPVMTSATLDSKTNNRVVINVAATDNKGIASYHVVETTHSINESLSAEEGKITITGLTAATEYSFVITAVDFFDNESDNNKTVTVTTNAYYTEPTAAATAPTWPADQVKVIYSPTYSANCGLGEWGSGTTVVDDTYGKKYTVGPNGGDGGYFGMVDFTLNCLMMEKLHFDIWVADDMSVRFVPIWGGAEQGITKNLSGQVWNSIDIDLTDYTGITNWGNITQMKLDHMPHSFNLWIANAYFYRESAIVDGQAPTNVSASVAARGFNSVKINAQAEDNSGAVSFKVLNGESILATGSAATGVSTTITVSSLTPGTNYNLNVIAYDEAGNEASPVVVATSTKALPSPAPTPNLSNKNVVPVFTDAMTGGKTDIHSGGWGESTIVQWIDIVPGNKVFYGQNFNFAGWHSWGADIDATDMVYLHVDVYSLGMTSVNVTPISHDPTHEGLATISLTPNAWTSADIALSAYSAANVEWNKIFQFKFMNPVGGDELLIDNVYFWQQTTQTTPVMGGDATTGGWATFSSPVKVAVPSGLTAYKATYSNEGGDEQLVLDAVSGAIPANEGVLLRGDADHVYTFSPTSDAAGDYTGNALVGCPARTDISSVAASNDIFCLRYSEIFQLTGFYLYSGQYIAAGKAYLPLPKDPGGAGLPQRKIRFVFHNEQTTTGIENADAETVQATKFMENGQLFIRRGDAVYTIQGARVK